MDQRNLKPAKEFAIQYGVKSLIYGPPGSGKTPILNTAPRPLLLACEPGLLSMRNSNVPTFRAFTVAEIEEFFKWFLHSNETKNFDTLGVDSVTQMAQIYLADIENGTSNSGKKVHGLAAYGDMAKRVMQHINALYYLPQKHMYLICKEGVGDDNGSRMKRPYFPGQQLNVDIPHLFDEILHLAVANIPGVGTNKAFRCANSIDILARDRTGMLAEFEPPDFSALIKKCLG